MYICMMYQAHAKEAADALAALHTAQQQLAENKSQAVRTYSYTQTCTHMLHVCICKQ